MDRPALTPLAVLYSEGRMVNVSKDRLLKWRAEERLED